MHFLNLPAELLLRIVYDIPRIQDKCQLMQTCTQLNTLLSNHPTCWSCFDLSPFCDINNTALLQFFKNCGIPLTSSESSVSKAITTLDISSCKYLSESMLAALCKTFTGLKVLNVNGYRLSNETDYLKGQTKNFDQLRDHVYQVLPSHGLSSMTMDLSKKSSQQLKVSFIMLACMLEELPELTSVSMQYQELFPLPWLLTTTPFVEFAHIQHVDISSCTITQPSLQMFIRCVGPQLITLKMLNIDFNHLTILCLRQHCKQLECLHLSCNDQGLLHAISHALSSLRRIKDFRMTRMWVGSVDAVISQLNTDILKRLDLSPKMSIYAKTVPATKTPAAQIKLAQQMNNHNTDNKHPNKTSAIPAISYATIEHDLHFTDASLYRLGSCEHLTELRLCFPMISAHGLFEFCQTMATRLRVFELRLKNRDDYSSGLPFLTHLTELYLYSVYLTSRTILSIASNLTRLKTLTVSDAGAPINHIDLESSLLSLPVLKVFRLGKLSKPLENQPDLNHEQSIVFTKHTNVWHAQ